MLIANVLILFDLTHTLRKNIENFGKRQVGLWSDKNSCLIYLEQLCKQHLKCDEVCHVAYLFRIRA